MKNVLFFVCVCMLVSFTALSQSNVGIGTATPTTTLDVAGTTTTQGFIMPTGAVNGYVLTSDASGEGTWQSAASAQYVQLGSQPSTIPAGQPFTYSTAVLASTSISAVTAIFNPPFTSSGTVFTLEDIGRYEVNYQMTYPTDGGIMLYLGSTIPTMLPLAYTMVGKVQNGAVSGSVIIETTTVNSFLSVNAAPGNAVAISIPPNSSTTNQNATTVSIKKIH